MSHMRQFTRGWPGATAGSLAALAAAWSVALADVPPDDVPPALQEAIASYVGDTLGEEYVGDCQTDEAQQNPGRWCSIVVSISDGTAEVSLGPVASDEISAVTFTEQAGGSWQAQDATEEVPAELTAAIRAYIEALGEEYAGDCRSDEAQSQLGNWCSSVVSLSDEQAEVSMGPVASDDIRTVTFVYADGAWQAAGSGGASPTPTTQPGASPTPAPPDTGTGTGTADGRDRGSDLFLAGLVVLLLGAAAPAGWLRLRR